MNRPPKTIWIIFHKTKLMYWQVAIKQTRREARMFCDYYNGFAKGKDKSFKYYHYEVTK